MKVKKMKKKAPKERLEKEEDELEVPDNWPKVKNAKNLFNKCVFEGGKV